MNKTYRILIVEDDEQIRDGIEIYLKSQGYETRKAKDGIDGLEILKYEKIHLAIVDVMMPRMDGIHMVMELRKTYDFPVIMLSAKTEEVDKILGLNMGADDYVTKPFQPLELIARVNSHLRRYERFLKMADYVYLTLDYAYLAGEEDNYKEMTELLKKSIDGLICMKHQCVNSILDISEIEELFFEYHDLMIELAEQGHYKWSDDVRESLSELVKTYGLNIRKRR